ncbi:MAG: RsmB/NOP family class I SAM-dependent RNA methyltransferase [Opitutaceae bacterium]|nr:RsmB/NOP family class I SAM-dependent RNA methyltransferase [Opitutaceae bacterium]
MDTKPQNFSPATHAQPARSTVDSAALNHAARILAAATDDIPADVALRHYFLETRHLGPREKRAISRAVFSYFRWLQWLDPKASFQKQVDHAWTLQERFRADEKSIKVETLAARAVPAWLHEEMAVPPEYLRQLQREPALWLRARPGTAAKLAQELGHCELSTVAPDAIRYTGHQDLFLTPAFHRGAFEIQDLTSQIVSHAAAPKPGETWWDACAGEGGKTLHLAALMANKGVVWASDRSERRLQILKRRAARAEIFNYRAALWDGSAKLPTKTKFDGILIDAPCSGVGTWQRNPHARWSATIDDVHELARVQRGILEHAAAALKPRGRLLYSVCTLTRSETSAVADAFSAAHPELQPSAVFAAAATPSPAAPPSAPAVTLWPHELNANGMFIAAWVRT